MGSPSRPIYGWRRSANCRRRPREGSAPVAHEREALTPQTATAPSPHASPRAPRFVSPTVERAGEALQLPEQLAPEAINEAPSALRSVERRERVYRLSLAFSDVLAAATAFVVTGV